VDEAEEYYKKAMDLLGRQLAAAERRADDAEKRAAETRKGMSQQIDRLLKLAEREPPADALPVTIAPSITGKKRMPIVQSTGKYKAADLDILFDQVIKRAEHHIKKETLESNKKELELLGRRMDIISMFGYSFMRSVYCTTYTKQLRLQLRLNKKDLRDKYTPLMAGEMKDSHKRVTRWVNQRCTEYSKMQGMAKIAESIDYRGLQGIIAGKLVHKRKELSEKSRLGKPRTPEDEREKASLIERDKSLRLISGRATQYFSTCGMFVLYLEIMGIPIGDVNAQVFVDFQNYINENKPLEVATLNNLRRDVMKFLTELATADETGYSFMPAIPYEGEGSIPRRKTEIGTAPPPPKVYWVELDDRRRLRKTRDDVRDVYKCIRVNRVGRDPELLEICLRFHRETGLRPIFATLVEFGDFTMKPVRYIGKSGTPVYQFKIGNIKRFEAGNKGIATYDMYISELLWNQINQYRKAERNADIYDEALLFNGVKLLGWNKDKHETPIATDQLTKDIFEPLSRVCSMRIRSEKFRDSYYTLMLATLNVKDVRAFKDWTGDTRTTAENNYRGVAESIDVPPPFQGANARYEEIVAAIFDKEEPVFADGDLANPKTCPDGTVIYRKVYRDGVWVDSGQRC